MTGFILDLIVQKMFLELYYYLLYFGSVRYMYFMHYFCFYQEVCGKIVE